MYDEKYDIEVTRQLRADGTSSEDAIVQRRVARDEVECDDKETLVASSSDRLNIQEPRVYERPREMNPHDFDRVEARDRWDFDDEVTRVFDNMLERSIPQYHTMRAAVDELAHFFAYKVAGPTPKIVDAGCSRGGAIARLIDRLPDATFLGLEISDPMLEAARTRFAPYEQVLILRHDLKKGLPYEAQEASVVLSVLTIQFTPIEYRQQIISEVYDSLVDGGAFIFVEKVLGRGRRINDAMVDTYHETKAKAGYTEEQIERKRLSLEGVLVPQTAFTNEWYLSEAGFKSVDCFWRWMNFAGWVAIK